MPDEISLILNDRESGSVALLNRLILALENFLQHCKPEGLCILMGCDALLPTEFLNKKGTLAILEKARELSIASLLVTESRKKIDRSDWKGELKDQPLFEWVPLNLIGRIVTERGI